MVRISRSSDGGDGGGRSADRLVPLLLLCAAGALLAAVALTSSPSPSPSSRPLLSGSVKLDEARPSSATTTESLESESAVICAEPHSAPDGGDCQALEGRPVRPEWACLSDMRSAIPAFAALYDHRPFRSNQGGTRFEHSFALWYMLRRLRPDAVIESGAFKGHGTWIVRTALPEARIISMDPNPPKSRLDGVEYLVGKDFVDFSKVDWEARGIDPDKTVVFLDDHQSAYKRAFLQNEHRFYRFLIDDNYGYLEGDAMSFKSVCEVERESLWTGKVLDDFARIEAPMTWTKHMEQVAFLKKALVTYYEFPPTASSELTRQKRYDPRYTSAPIVTDPGFFEEHLAKYNRWHNWGELTSYFHFSYVEIDPAVIGEAPSFP
eukprot:CAMPEP_0197445512 /NCGR_PEP_ID=MMETSP1175-20131217/10714_1 /TAXON_ID=1003142 /ORGANISM="Triceratium dubium, Strain CCMP147" /LENGTH=377 /DNA_ID=CAMNT_0042976483 /DNA_START=218 /DNA_END=1351 /DNA_ORIENTATION=+